eukprot:1011151_1
MNWSAEHIEKSNPRDTLREKTIIGVKIKEEYFQSVRFRKNTHPETSTSTLVSPGVSSNAPVQAIIPPPQPQTMSDMSHTGYNLKPQPRYSTPGVPHDMGHAARWSHQPRYSTPGPKRNSSYPQEEIMNLENISPNMFAQNRNNQQSPEFPDMQASLMSPISRTSDLSNGSWKSQFVQTEFDYNFAGGRSSLNPQPVVNLYEHPPTVTGSSERVEELHHDLNTRGRNTLATTEPPPDMDFDHMDFDHVSLSAADGSTERVKEFIPPPPPRKPAGFQTRRTRTITSEFRSPPPPRQHAGFQTRRTETITSEPHHDLINRGRNTLAATEPPSVTDFEPESLSAVDGRTEGVKELHHDLINRGRNTLDATDPPPVTDSEPDSLPAVNGSTEGVKGPTESTIESLPFPCSRFPS